MNLDDSLEVDPDEVAAFLGLGDPRFFEFEYRRYRPDLSVFIQARVDGRLVGTQALVPYPLRISGKPVMTGRSERTMVDSSLRGTGAFRQLMRRCAARGEEKGLSLIWGTTTAKVPFQRAGFLYFDRFYEHALLCTAPSRVPADVRAPQPPKLRAAKLACAVPSLAMRAVSVVCQPRLEVASTLRHAGDVDALYDDLRGETPLVTMHHEASFLDWLLEQSGHAVRRYYAYDGATLVAYAYVALGHDSTATFLDFAARNAAGMISLVRAIVGDVARDGVVFLHARYNARNPLLARQRRWLILAGFMPFFRGGGFVVRPLCFDDFNYLSDLSRWYITELWFQLYASAG
jgi:GNAT superfamily N-acetyltransferase